MDETEYNLQANSRLNGIGNYAQRVVGELDSPEEFARRRAEWEAGRAREAALSKMSSILGTFHHFGTVEDIEAVTKAIAKIAAKAMRRRA